MFFVQFNRMNNCFLTDYVYLVQYLFLINFVCFRNYHVHPEAIRFHTLPSLNTRIKPHQAIFFRDFKHCLITIFQSTDIIRPAPSPVPVQCCERGSPSSRHFLLQYVTRRSLNLCLRYTSACLMKHTSRTRWRI